MQAGLWLWRPRGRSQEKAQSRSALELRRHQLRTERRSWQVKLLGQAASRARAAAELLASPLSLSLLPTDPPARLAFRPASLFYIPTFFLPASFPADAFHPVSLLLFLSFFGSFPGCFPLDIVPGLSGLMFGQVEVGESPQKFKEVF